jgi:hypothetical protein
MAESEKPQSAGNLTEYIDRLVVGLFSGTNPRILERKLLSQGTVFVVLYDQGDRKNRKFYVWQDRRRGTFQRFDTGEDVVGFIADLETQKFPLIDKLFSTEVIAGIIAFCFLVIIVVTGMRQGAGHIDPVMASAISVIVGFYFGREAKR